MEIKFDQHFLIDNRIIKKTLDIANINSNDIIYEIGPGKCYLTKEILKYNPNKLISIEIDKQFEQNLSNLKNKNKNFEYYFLDGVSEISNFKFTKLIANIPYAITEPLYKRILDLKLDFIILLHGKTFYETIIRRESKWNYLINAFYNIDLIEEVNGNSFNPPTKTKSVLVKLNLKFRTNIFEDLIQELYLKKRRTIKNAIIFSLVEIIKLSKKEAKKVFDNLDINKNIGNLLFENISNEDFCNILSKLKIYINKQYLK